MKMSQRTQSMVLPSELSSLFMKISIIWDALSSCNLFNDIMHAKRMCHGLTQGIRTIKTFLKYKKSYCWYIYHRKGKEAVSNIEFTMTKRKAVKSKVPSISCKNFAKFFKFLLHFIYILLLTSHWCF